MGIKPQDVFTTREASCRGLGQADVDLITILGERLQDFIKQPFLLPSTSLLRKKIPQPIAKLAQRMIKYRPYVKFDKCLRCLACVKACPETCIILRDKRIVFDYSQCIACFCCQEVCPVSAIKVKKSLFARLIGL
jgi:Pyruvate/2-oxoacid:ferredoxin oxidoreductase delta subunit